MKSTLFLLITSSALACSQAPQASESAAAADSAATAQAAVAPQAEAAQPEPWADIPVVSIDELETMMSAETCTVVDANGVDTRKEFGVIPGAVQLTNYKSDTMVSELPSDKDAKLVFYCGSTRCMAAPKAAAKAREAGYTNVAHLKAGIRGWVGAGKKVDKPS